MRNIGNIPVDGKVRAVASGTLPSGKPVVVNSDGTVSVVGLESVSQAIGSPAVFESADTAFTSSTFDSNSNKVVIAYSDYANNYYGTAVVGTVSGTSISFGTPVVYESASVFYVVCTFDSNLNKVVIAYRDADNSSYGTAVVGTVSGTSISFGTPVVFESATVNTKGITFDSNLNKVVIAYSDSGNSGYGTSIVGTVSGTAISFGSPVVFASADTQNVSTTFDSASNKVVIAYRDVGNDNYGTAIVGTVSGTAISFGSEAVFESGFTPGTSCTFDSNSNKVVIVYPANPSSFGQNYGHAVVATVSGTSISFGTPVVYESADTSTGSSCTFDSLSNKVVIAYTDGGNSSYGTVIVGTVSGTNISFGSPAVFESASSSYISTTFDSSSNKVVVAYRDVGNSNYGTSVVFQPDYTSANLTSENYIGMSGGVIKTFSQSEALGTESTFETGEVYTSASGYHVAEKKTLLMFQDASDSNKIKGRLVTATGTTLSYGSIVEVTGQVGGVGAVVYDSANEKLVVIFRGNTNYATAVVATISGSSLTFGTPVVFNSAASGGSSIYGAYDSTSGKIVVSYAGSGAGTGNLKVGTASGTSITFGSATSLGVGVYETVLAYDPVNDKTIVGSYTSDTSDGKAWVGTVSGTSISVGSPTTFNTNIAGVYGIFHDAPSGKVGFIVQTGAGPGEAYVGTVSGTSISFGSGVQFQSGISQGFSGYDSRVNKFTVACRSITSPYPGLMRVGTISGDTFSFASAVTFNSGGTTPLSVGFDSDQGTSIIAFSDGGDSDIAKAIGFQAAGSYEVSSSVADGDSAVINSTCTVDSNQSGLTAGQQYFVQTDGTLSETPADPSVLAGTAVSATKLIVKG